MVALVDQDGTGRNVTATTLLSGLTAPNGVAWHDGTLYVAETRRITSYPNADAVALAGQVSVTTHMLSLKIDHVLKTTGLTPCIQSGRDHLMQTLVVSLCADFQLLVHRQHSSKNGGCKNSLSLALHP